MLGNSRFSTVFMSEITKYFSKTVEYNKNAVDTTYGKGGTGCFLGIKFKLTLGII